MKLKKLMSAAIISVATLSSFSSFADTAHVDKIIERLQNANDHRDHVMIVAHRGLWIKNGEPIYAEGSITAIEKAIELGIEAIEQDIRRTKDGVLIGMHDETLDRTTTCTGAVAEKLWAELQKCRLVITDNLGNNRIETEDKILTLEEIFSAIKGDILLNLDNKIGVEYFPEMFELAKQAGVEHQILATINQNDEEQRKAATKMVASLEGSKANFLPNLYDSHVDLDVVNRSLEEFTPAAIQLRNYHAPDGKITMDGGVLFSAESRKLAEKYNTHMWINTLYTYREMAGMRSGGRGDEMAVYANLPSEVYGFWVDKGVTIFQTDEPEFAMKWLQENGYRQPYN
ncbi:glycerophosphodiester phosphodiesterase [Photobacterium sanctipauli]|uniref:Glycerophosphodiester phosphodiesterase n=1 Tax=Photobacterium sanctipauli TaxID=1342794 RepID=A0A2T3NPS4_9GAMM|nr:glycerophosphodiester phosphodiesterase family protein [Photobacterium sanctipauli]PSW18207.1 glycerophosphodiester phosphodiesterase [Photobacterium sanctipauli]